ncbi:CPBP family intramembrane glutamic endopeptidase [Algisphaera agarilytica]|uniref:Membrane protease YdiL (CAAX protease family) n=1 Tax=Algisphaera agarilytica TaxID=1385975 RepID=A0A7X0H6F2_9BACT|nr:type II CAAX endopeptidase family protein [Algisphaera agarilytica]MBB6430145.1 membrane protease YdiL (CAAX protease family) [Algisphaera agarilytica]
MIQSLFNLAAPTLGAEEVPPWPDGAIWGAALVVILAMVVVAVKMQGPMLRRGPLREIDFTHADIVIGFGLVGMIFLDKVLIGLGGQFIDWPKNVSLGIQQVSALALIGGAVFFFGKAWMTEAGLRKAGFVPRQPGRDLVYTLVSTPVGVLFTFATLLTVNGVATAAGHPSPEVNHGMLKQLEDADLQLKITIIVTAVVVGPFLEEIVFRGLLQTLLLEVLGRKARWATILIASAIFAFVHIGAVSWHALPGLMMLGIVLGWMYEKTGSLLPVYLVHAAFNGLNILIVLQGWSE